MGKDRNVRPLVIIPGPKQPNNLGTYLLPLLQDFQDLGKFGMKVRDTKDGPEYIHKPLLGGVLADSPARCKVTRWNACGAYLACGWCLFEGQQYSTSKEGDGKHIYYKGYKERVLHTISGHNNTM